jgi:hypothetical protein
LGRKGKKDTSFINNALKDINKFFKVTTMTKEQLLAKQ